MARCVLLLFGILVLSGCSLAPVKINPMATGELRDQSLTVAQHPPSDFVDVAPGTALFGLIGYAIQVKKGADIVQQDGLNDPAVRISAQLANRLASVYDMRLVANTVIVPIDNSGKPAALANLYGAAHYVLDVKTSNWNLLYYPTHWGTYRVIYTADFQLIDTHTNKVVAQATCKEDPDYTNTSLTYDHILANHGVLLKGQIQEEIVACVRDLEQFISS